MIIHIILYFFLLALVTKNIKYFFLSPIYLYVLFSSFSIIISLWYFYYYEPKISLFGLDDVSENTFINTIKFYTIGLNSFLFGVLLYHNSSNKDIRKIFLYAMDSKLFVDFTANKGLIKFTTAFFWITILIYLIGYGDTLFYRDYYLPPKQNIFSTLLKTFTFIAVILIGLIYNERKNQSRMYFFILILFSIGTGSRVVFLFLIIYAVIKFLIKGNTLKNKLSFLFSITLSFVFLAYLMVFRSLPHHGIIPYIESLFHDTGGKEVSVFFNVYYSLIFGVYATIATVKKAIPDWNIIFLSFNPLPGKMIGWYDVASTLRINRHAPFTLHGRVFSMGYVFTVIYFLIIGLFFSYVEKYVRILLNRNNRGVSFLLILLSLLHIVYAFEYNMRSSIRYLYYILIAIILYKGSCFIIKILPKKNAIKK